MEISVSHFFFNLRPFLLLLVASTFFRPSSSTDIYTGALLTLKSDLAAQEALHDWSISSSESNNTTIIACSWSGVTCNSNGTSVTALDLSGRNLRGVLSGEQLRLFTELEDFNLSFNSFSGNLPQEIFGLRRLRTLDISRNNFSGHFPGNISFSGAESLVLLDAFSNSFSGTLPINLHQIGTLEVLNLAGSYFSGEIPAAYGSFKNLKFIHLAGNFLGGRIPPELGNLQTLTHMEIGYNTYNGGIPWQFGNLTDITYLDIAGANLTGYIPRDLSNLTKLESFFVFKNQLVGSIPWEFGGMESLSALDLSDNLISGAIPSSFSELKKLKLLSLFYNLMNGSVPDSMSELPELETLLLWNNLFTGPLPATLGKNRNLKWLDVSTNRFTGEIPLGICSGGGLTKLIMFENKFSGSLSPSISNCSSLVRLRLEDNVFSGEISVDFSGNVTYIDLSRNQFTGSVPHEILEASELQYFNISKNSGIHGPIPATMWALPALANFSAAFCNLTGTIPSFRSCGPILSIELNGNRLSGPIPASISECRELARIDLSENTLTGTIPEKLGFSPSMREFNISYNDISGSIPSTKFIRSLDETAFVGNPRLCGAPLRPCHGSVKILGTKGTSGRVVLVCLGLVALTTMVALGLICFYRGSKRGQWKMVWFDGLPRFKPTDILHSFDVTEPSPTRTAVKAVLPTGITVSVKKLNWGPKRFEFVAHMGEARHPNLARLLGVCHNRDIAYLLYDYLPNGNLSDKLRMKRDWKEKFRIVIGIARGLYFLHHECFPAIPHGDLKSSNVGYDENMELRLMDFGFGYLHRLPDYSHKGSGTGF